MVQARTVVRPGRDAAVLRLPEVAPAGLALTVDGNGRWCAVDPYGGRLATALEAGRNSAPRGGPGTRRLGRRSRCGFGGVLPDSGSRRLRHAAGPRRHRSALWRGGDARGVCGLVR